MLSRLHIWVLVEQYGWGSELGMWRVRSLTDADLYNIINELCLVECRTRTRRRAVTRRTPVSHRAAQQRPVITAQSSSSGSDDDDADDDYSANERSSSANSSDADYRRRSKWLTKRMAAQAVRYVSQAFKLSHINKILYIYNIVIFYHCTALFKFYMFIILIFCKL